MQSLDEYKQIKKDQDSIGTMRIIPDVYYANKDGGLMFKPYMTLILEKNKSGSDFKEDVKVNFESCLLVVERYPYGACSLMTLLCEENKDWEE